MADPSMHNFFSQSQTSAPKPSKHAAAPSTTTSSPRCYTCIYCPRKFDTSRALGSPQNGHKRERAAARQNFPAANQQQYHPLPLFPAYQQEQPTSSIPFPHFPGMYLTADAAVLEPIQPQAQPQPQQQQHLNLASSSVPQGFLGVSNADALSPTANVDDSANLDLTLRL